MIRLPHSIKGRNFPKRPLVRSSKNPTIGSVTASNTFCAVKIPEINTMLKPAMELA